MAELVDQISEVETRTLPTGVVIYVIKDSNGKEYSTRDRSMAQEAYAAVGKTAHLEFTEKKSGDRNQFTNRYLNQFAVVDEPGNGQTGLGFAQPAFAGQDPFADTQPEPVGRDATGDRDLAIAKAVALKEGVNILQYLPENERTVVSVTKAAEYFLAWLREYRP